jgi:hypothetical protein
LAAAEKMPDGSLFLELEDRDLGSEPFNEELLKKEYERAKQDTDVWELNAEDET